MILYRTPGRLLRPLWLVCGSRARAIVAIMCVSVASFYHAAITVIILDHHDILCVNQSASNAYTLTSLISSVAYVTRLRCRTPHLPLVGVHFKV